MMNLCVEASVVAVAPPEPTEVDIVFRGEEYTASVEVGAIRVGSCFFVRRGDVVLVRAMWDLVHRRCSNASLTAAGAACFTIEEAIMLVAVGERAMAEELSEIER